MSKPPPELVREWYARAEAGGFRDIETQAHPDGPARARYTSPLDAAATAEYYRQAGDYMRRNGRRFSKRDRRILRLHVDGVPYSEIAATVGLSEKSKHVVAEVVAVFRARMMRARRMGWRRGQLGEGCVRVTVRLSDAEAAILAALAQRIGRTMSYTLRGLLTAGADSPSERDRMAEILGEIVESER